jgi:hypothetical protein
MSATSYPGPLRDEPLAIELHNTLYAVAGTSVDGLDDAADEWLDGLAERLPGGSGRRPAARDLIELRDAVHAALRAAVEGAPQDRATLDAIHRASARAAMSPAALWDAGGDPVATIDYHGAGRADIVLATLAADAIDLITGPPARPATHLQGTRLRAHVPQGPPAPRMVLEHLRQPRPPGTALRPRPPAPPAVARLTQAPQPSREADTL